MGLIKIENIGNKAPLGVWKLEEQVDDLIELLPLPENEIATLNSFKVASRKAQWLTARLLIMKMMDSYPLIAYKESGKPYLTNSNKSISISHTKEYVTCVVSDFNSGVDIELINDKVQRIASKFLSTAELQFANNNIETLTTLWSAKEALYKLYGKGELSFANQLKIDSYVMKDTGEMKGEIILEQHSSSFTLDYQRIENHILVYVIE